MRLAAHSSFNLNWLARRFSLPVSTRIKRVPIRGGAAAPQVADASPNSAMHASATSAPPDRYR